MPSSDVVDALLAFEQNPDVNPIVQMPRQRARTTTPVYTLGGTRLEASQEIPHTEKTAGQMAVESIPELLAIAGGPAVRGVQAGMQLARNAPTAAGVAGLLGLTAGSGEAAGPSGKLDPALKALFDSDPVLRALQDQIDEQQKLSTSPNVKKSDRERATTEASRLRSEMNARIKDLSKSNLPFDKANPELAMMWPAIQWAGPVAAAWLTKNTGNLMQRILTAPWRKTVEAADSAQKLGAKGAEAFLYNAGRAGSFLKTEQEMGR